jgi:N-acetylglucosaminyl-diphospho-decaprenol L-rhamnosyltransferase
VGSVSVVIVTYNSGVFISNLMSALEAQTKLPDSIVIVDSGSTNTDYLERARTSTLECTLIMKPNVGVCVGNNIGWAHSKDHDYILYLNPDAFLAPDFLELAVQYMDDPANRGVGMVSGTLLGYDIENDRPTGLVDSTGVVQLWYGRIADRDQSAPISVLKKYSGPNSVPSVCSAVALCRRATVLSIAPTGEVFDPRYFMYKDDIDFSWRARRAGWTLIHHPKLSAYHCRGWSSRAAQSRKMRLLSARNDIKLFLKFRSPYLVWGIAKYVLVFSLDL